MGAYFNHHKTNQISKILKNENNSTRRVRLKNTGTYCKV
jgi:hypothetical protein